MTPPSMVLRLKSRFMNRLKFICLTTLRLVKQACQLPRSFVYAVEQRQQQAVRNKLEAERLDRLRNPSKYLGK